MKTYRYLFLRIIVLISIAGAAYLWANKMMDSIYAYRSPLHANPPASKANPLSSPITRRVVIILVDALREDTSMNTQIMPVTNEFRQAGAWATMHSQPPSYSASGYSTLFTGAWPDINDGPAFNPDYADIPTWTQEDLFTLAHQAGMKTAISGYYYFEKLVPQNSLTESFFTPGEDESADKAVIKAALPWLKDPSYRLILIHIDQVDFAGHYQGGAASPAWAAAANRTDQIIGQIGGLLDLSQDTLVILSDHGQILSGGHGGHDSDTLLEPFILVGKSISPGEKPDIQMVDVSPTLAGLLGIPIPASAQGEPQWDMLTIDSDIRKTYMEVQQTNWMTLNQKYAEAIRAKKVIRGEDGIAIMRQERLTHEVVLPGITAILALIAGCALIYLRRQVYTIPAILSSIVFVALYHFMFFILDHQVYSFSKVEGAAELITGIAINCAISLTLATVFYHFLLRKESKTVLKWVNTQIGYCYILLSGLFIPVLLHWVINGAYTTWTLPRLDLYFIGLSFLIQMMVVAGLGLVSIAITAGISTFLEKKARMN
jgi:hypothetical protein